MHSNATTANVLRFWQSVEAFSQQHVPRLSTSRAAHPYVGDYVAPEDELPWLDATWPAPRDHHRWIHQVYVGTFDLASAWQVICPKDPTTEAISQQDHGAVFTMQIRGDGTIVQDSGILSQGAWSVGEFATQRNLAAVASGFALAADQWKHDLAGLIRRGCYSTGAEDPNGTPTQIISKSGLAALFHGSVPAAMRAHLHFRGGDLGLRIASRQFRANAEEPLQVPADDVDFLNSFFTEDLVEAAAEETHHPPVAAYFGEADRPPRVDVRKNLAAVFDAVAPRNVPLGRWPSSPTQPLSLSQQLAVNSSIHDLNAGAGLFGVNGPPGTGKTTLLRDIVAALVTDRAVALSAFARPKDAYVDSVAWRSKSEHERVTHLLHPSLRGYEIVVASSNNGAVENLSLELPAAKAIDGEFRDRASDPLSEITEILLGTPPNTPLQERPWSLIAGRLGSSKNRRQFAGALAYGREESKHQPAVAGIYDRLYSPPDGVDSWPLARSRFLASLRRVDGLREARQRAHELFLPLLTLEAEASELRLRQNTQQAELERITRGDADSRGRLDESRQALDAAHRSVQASKLARPSLVARIRTFGRADDPWRHQMASLARRVAALEQKCEEDEANLQLVRSARARTRIEMESAQNRLAESELRISEIEEVIGAQGERAPGRSWFSGPDEIRESTSPWLDSEFNRARSELFIDALSLHRAFLFATPKESRDNVFSAMDVLSNRTPAGLSSQTVRGAWEALFLTVPVVSTTFASIPRMFRTLGPERLGWLIVDEAGQAAPQHALSGVRRMKRCLMVGDPLQLQPVITLPDDVQTALLSLSDCTADWLPRPNPAQVLADRATRFITTIDIADRPSVTVGSPLRMHRRCNDPMFSVINESVYGGLMMHGGDPRSPCRTADGRDLAESAWLDVITTEWAGHSSKAEGVRLEELLAALQEVGWRMDDVLVVSPFRDTADMIKRIVRPFGIDARTRTGTVHTAQGKEAGIVIVVLGGSTGGARQQMVAAPNLFNVAVSRAQQRLFIIGSHSNWSTVQYFHTLAARLHVVPADVELRDIVTRLGPGEPDGR